MLRTSVPAAIVHLNITAGNQWQSQFRELQGKVDILLAIDPSGSMNDKRARLMAPTETFASGAAKGKLDFHLGSFAPLLVEYERAVREGAAREVPDLGSLRAGSRGRPGGPSR